MTEEILRVENQKGLDPRAISIRQGDTTELTVKLIGLETGGLSGKVYLVKDELKYFEESVTVDKDGAVSFSIKDNLPAGQYDLEIIVGSKHKFPSAYYSFIVTVHPSVEYAEENLIRAYGKKQLIADVSKIVKKGAKGESGESITIKRQSKDRQGNSVIEFSDGTTVTVNKGDKGDRGPRGLQGPPGKDGVVTFESLSDEQIQSLKGAKGDKGEPFKYSDFTTAQLKALKGEKGDKGDPATETFTKPVADKYYQPKGNYLTNIPKQYVTETDLDNKSDLKVLDTRNDDRNPLWYMNNYGSKQVFEFKYRRNVGNPPEEASASKNYTIILTRVPWRDKSGGYPTQLSFGERIALRIGTSETTWGKWKTLATLDDTKDMVVNVGVNSRGNIVYQKANDKAWQSNSLSSVFSKPVAFKDHTHSEYIKRDESPFVVSSNPPENKKTMWIKDDNVRDITDRIGTYHPSVIYTGSLTLLGVEENEYNAAIQMTDTSAFEKLNQNKLIIDFNDNNFKADKFYCIKNQFLCLAFNNENENNFIHTLLSLFTPESSDNFMYAYTLFGQEVNISVVTGHEEYSTLHYYHDSKKTWQTIG